MPWLFESLLFRFQALTETFALKGFWLLLHFQKMSLTQVSDLANKISQVLIQSAVYTIEDIQQAVAHAGSASRNGKILVTPMGRCII